MAKETSTPPKPIDFKFTEVARKCTDVDSIWYYFSREAKGNNAKSKKID